MLGIEMVPLVCKTCVDIISLQRIWEPLHSDASHGAFLQEEFGVGDHVELSCPTCASELVELSFLNGESDGFTLDPPSAAPGPDRALMHAEDAGLITRALEELGGPCQEVIELRYFADLSYEEISAELKLNPKTVSSRLSKCLDKLEGFAAKYFPPAGKNLREKNKPMSV